MVYLKYETFEELQREEVDPEEPKELSLLARQVEADQASAPRLPSCEA